MIAKRPTPLTRADKDTLIQAVEILRRHGVYQEQTTAGGYIAVLDSGDSVSFETLDVTQFDFNGCDAETVVLTARRSKAGAR